MTPSTGAAPTFSTAAAAAAGNAEAAAELARLKAEAMVALRQGRLDLADRLLLRGDVSLQELTHNLRVYQVELQAQAQELRDSQSRLERTARQFRRLFEALPLPALVTDRAGAVLSQNLQAEMLLQMSVGMILKPTIRRLLADEASRTAVNAALQLAQAEGHARVEGVVVPHPDRQTHTFDLFIELLDQGDGEGARFVLLFVDETERIAAGRVVAEAMVALREQQRDNRRLAAVARSTHSIVLVTDALRRITWVNAAFTRTSGYTLADVSGRTLVEALFGPATDPVVAAELQRALDRGEGLSDVEVLNYARDGQPFWALLDIQPVRGDDGQIEQFVVVERDVSDRKRDEARLRESEAWQRAVFEAAPGMVAALQADGRLQSINRAGVALLSAASADALLGRALADFFSGDGPARYRRLHAAALLGEAGRDEFELRDATGAQAMVELHVAPMWRGGAVNSVVAVSRDLTAELEARALRLQKDAADAANRAKTEFLSRMSHELRTPLNAVLGFTQLMQMDLGNAAAETQKARLAHIERAGWHLLAMINDVLDLSRIESDQLDLHLQTLPLAPVVEDALALVETMAQARPVTLSMHVSPALLVHGDALRLKQVITNLLSNAVKYNHAGGWVRVSAEAQGGRVLLAVADNGPGLDAAQAGSLFEPFNRLGANTQIEGTGIGLVIARRLAELMGATIEVISPPGAGCTFTVNLALALDMAPETAQQVEAEVRALAARAGTSAQ